MSRPDYVIGIDPDVERNGYALLDMETHKVIIETVALPALIDMVDSVQSSALATDKRLTVFVEAGWLVHSNWHLGFRDSKANAAAKGKSVGRNHQRGMDICELLTYRGISVVQVPPLKKVWRGPDRKITQEELTAIVGPVKRTNQEGRDAALLAWYHAGLPIRIRPKPKRIP